MSTDHYNIIEPTYRAVVARNVIGSPATLSSRVINNCASWHRLWTLKCRINKPTLSASLSVHVFNFQGLWYRSFCPRFLHSVLYQLITGSCGGLNYPPLCAYSAYVPLTLPVPTRNLLVVSLRAQNTPQADNGCSFSLFVTESWFSAKTNSSDPIVFILDSKQCNQWSSSRQSDVMFHELAKKPRQFRDSSQFKFFEGKIPGAQHRVSNLRSRNKQAMHLSICITDLILWYNHAGCW